jgi:hypothetical protein
MFILGISPTTTMVRFIGYILIRQLCMDLDPSTESLILEKTYSQGCNFHWGHIPHILKLHFCRPQFYHWNVIHIEATASPSSWVVCLECLSNWKKNIEIIFQNIVPPTSKTKDAPLLMVILMGEGISLLTAGNLKHVHTKDTF